MELPVLALVTFFAAAVNGAVGYGFSSLTVPIALLFFSNKVLNPALVIVAIALNGYVLAVNRRSVPVVAKRVLPVLLGLAPGIVCGGVLLASLNSEWLKFLTYISLVPLILLQAGGLRWPLKSERTIGLLLGSGVGTLYSATTISGPPMALLFNNQGLVQRDFRAAMALLRVAEAVLALLTYYVLGLFNAGSLELSFWVLPSVLLDVPIGSFLINRVDAETFRRICMSYDAWIVGFGLSRVFIVLQLITTPAAYTVWLAIAAIDSYLLYAFFTKRKISQAPA